jgi:sensor histidine kinase YesM
MRYVSPPALFAPITVLQNRLLLHTGFWIVVAIVSLVSNNWGGEQGTALPEWLTCSVWDLSSNMIWTYVVVWILVPLLFYRKHFISYGIAGVSGAFVMCFLSEIVYKHIFRNNIVMANAIHYLNFFGINILFLFLVTGIKFAKDLLIIQHNDNVEKQARVTQELSFLKGQLSPHFLLNTMNNLYGLSVIKSDDLPKLMLRLSDLLRYTVYDAKAHQVPLKEELDYLKDYIALQRIRLNKNFKLTTNFPEQVEDSVQIAPLLLVVFVENAFKHSNDILYLPERFIDINISVQDSVLFFSIKNTFEIQPKDAMLNNVLLRKDGGVGLETTLRRIELLYGKEGLPVIKSANNVYCVQLTLNLKNGTTQMSHR